MAVKKISELTAITTIASDDELPVVDKSEDETKKVTPEQIKTYAQNGVIPNDGWIPVSDNWTYASATTINVPSGATGIYQKGDKLRLKQGGSYKYYYIITVADTLLTVSGGTDYTVANSTITDVYYSHIENPFGFPINGFNWTPTIGGSATFGTATYTNQLGKIKILSGGVTAMDFRIGWTNMSGGSGYIVLEGWKNFGSLTFGTACTSGVLAVYGATLFSSSSTLTYSLRSSGGNDLLPAPPGLNVISYATVTETQHYMYGTIILFLT